MAGCGNNANVWQPRKILDIDADNKSVAERIVSLQDQSTFYISEFAYVLGTGALSVHKNGLLLSQDVDWVEQTTTSFSTVVACDAGDILVATGMVGIEGTVPNSTYSEESVILAALQTTVLFPTTDLTTSAVYIGSTGVDRGRLIKSVDYTVTNTGAGEGQTAEIELAASYPAGTYCTAVAVDVVGSTTLDKVGYKTLAEAVADGTALEGDSVIISDRGNGLFEYKSGETPDGGRIIACTGIPTLSLVQQDISTLSANEYATFGSNVVVDATALNHTAGTVEILDAAINVLADTYYRVTVDITTTTSGFVRIEFGNDTVPANQVEAIFGDQSNGFWFSTETILADGTENNRILTTNVYTYSLYTSSTAFTNLHIETDTLWGGNIGSITIQEVTEKPAYSKITPSDGVDRGFYTGIKGGSVNRNDMAIGDKSALGMFVYDGVSPTPAHNVALGSRSLSALQHGDENTGLGTFSLQGNEGSNNTAVGYSALKICNKGQENTSMGYKSGTFVTTGYKNTFLGFWAGAGIRTGRENVDIGWKPNLEPSDRSLTTSIGSSSGLGVNIGDANTFVGRNAANTVSGTPTLTLSSAVAVGADSKPWGNNSVCLGFQSKVGLEGTFADYAISIGDNATAFGEDSIAIGHTAVTNGVGSVAIGESSLTSNNNCTAIGSDSVAGADEAVAVGKSADATASRATAIGGGSFASSQSVAVGGLSTPSGTNNTAVGFRALNNFTGTANTAVGHTAGLQAAVAYTNCTLLGSLTTVTGSNQVQLGDSATTTYAYGAVQDRSDIRDKLDVKDLTDAHIAFFMDIEWKQYRMNHRERYIDVVEHVEIEEKPIFHELHPEMIIGTEEVKHVTYERVEVDNDGSRAGSRFHIGAIAQQVEAAMKKHDVDFAGLQHHSVNGGEDVYTIGYQEFTGIQGLIIQRQQVRLLSIEERLTTAGI